MLKKLNPETTEEDVRVFVKDLSKKQPKFIKFHHDRTAAMIGFSEKIGNYDNFFSGIG